MEKSLLWKPFNESWHNLKATEAVLVPADSLLILFIDV